MGGGLKSTITIYDSKQKEVLAEKICWRENKWGNVKSYDSRLFGLFGHFRSYSDKFVRSSLFPAKDAFPVVYPKTDYTVKKM